MLAPLAVTRLTLTRFRSYAYVRLTVPACSVVLTGPNGSGKTNLLEALSLFAPGRGLRGARLTELERIDPGAGVEAEGSGWAVAAGVQTPDAGLVEIGTGTTPGSGDRGSGDRDGGGKGGGGKGGGDRRVVRIDGRTSRSTALPETLSLIWLTPQMDGLLMEGSGSRRRFLDRMVFGLDPAHAGRLSRYEKVLRERAHLLRSGRADPAWLTALEDTLATTGVAIAAARRDFVQRLDRACRSATGPFPRATAGLTGAVDAALAAHPALVVEDSLRADYRSSRNRDAEMGGSAIGPHRSDLVVAYIDPGAEPPGRPVSLCSTGEQKALLIALVLGHARVLAATRGLPPLLLLDDVAAHLDADRRAALFEALESLRCQAWMTGTDTASFAALDERVHWLTLRDGHPTEGR